MRDRVYSLSYLFSWINQGPKWHPVLNQDFMNPAHLKKALESEPVLDELVRDRAESNNFQRLFNSHLKNLPYSSNHISD
jgi:hypothetical protein